MKRFYTYDVLRSLAAFMVVGIHTTIYYWNDHAVGSLAFVVSNIVNCFGRSAVPIFFMLSGAMMLQQERGYQYLWKKIAHLIVVYVICSAVYAAAEQGSNIINLPVSAFLNSFVEGKYHLWFLPVMICIYVMSPVLYAFVHFENGKYVRYAVGMFLICGIIKNTLLVLFPQKNILPVILGKCSVELCEYTGYFILGYFLHTLYERKNKLTQICFFYLTALGIAFAFTQIMSLVRGVSTNVFNSYFSLPVFVEAACLFLIFKQSNNFIEKIGKTRLIQSMSGCSLGIYLVHPFIIEHMDSLFGINTEMCNALVSIPMITIISFGGGYVTVYIYKRILRVCKESKIGKRLRLHKSIHF